MIFLVKSLFLAALNFLLPSSARGHGMIGELRSGHNENSADGLFDPTTLSNWISSVWHRGKYYNGWHNQVNRRSLQDTTQVPCGGVMETWTKDETVSNVQDILRSAGAVEDSQTNTLVALLQTLIKNGVRIQKICGSCQDFPDIGGPCADGNYGADVTHSGLMVVPLDESSGQIVSGSHRAVLYMHPSRANGSYQDWQNDSQMQVDVLLNVISTAIGGSVSILPDYMGYGESLNVTCKSYLIRQGYSIAAIPLFEAAKETVKKETNCAASVANAVALIGYSEGGYSALAVADTMNSLGYKIIRLQMGAAPMRLSSFQFGLTFKRLRENTTLPLEYALVEMFGLAYSSTCKSLVNYGVGQDLIDSQYKKMLLNYSNRDASQEVLLDIFPVEDPTSIVNNQVWNATLPALESDVLNLCAATSIVEGTTDVLCQALQDQDLDAVLLNVTYPTSYCYSVNDTTVSPQHIPEGASENPNIEFLTTVGTHWDAGAFCLVQDLYFLTGQDFASFEITADMVDACEASSTLAPSQNEGGSSSEMFVSYAVPATLSLVSFWLIII